MDASHQGVGGLVKVSMEGSRPVIERKARPQKDQALNCPRCNSTNTKFCYYNNYSLSQPRYFCKTCRRYWTEGGSQRNVPVGGGSRKNKRSSSSSTATATTPVSASSSPNKKLPDLISSPPTGFPQSHASQNPKIHQGQDLNLDYLPPPSDHQDYTNLPKFMEAPYSNESNNQQTSTSSLSSSSMELLRAGMTSRELGSFTSMPLPNPSALYSSGLPGLPDFKPTLSFSMGEFGSAYGSSGAISQGVEETGARILFPLEELKPESPSSSTIEFYHSRGGQGIWNGMLGGGSW